MPEDGAVCTTPDSRQRHMQVRYLGLPEHASRVNLPRELPMAVSWRCYSRFMPRRKHKRESDADLRETIVYLSMSRGYGSCACSDRCLLEERYGSCACSDRCL